MGAAFWGTISAFLFSSASVMGIWMKQRSQAKNFTAKHIECHERIDAKLATLTKDQDQINGKLDVLITLAKRPNGSS